MGTSIGFFWNGRALHARPGDTIAAALWRNGVRSLAVSRKRHRPLGLSGCYLQGVLVQVDGEPHVRADERQVSAGMRVCRQNAWPSTRLDLLRVFRWLPQRWTSQGFERSMMFPGGTRRFAAWERLLMFLAGEVKLDPLRRNPAASPSGRRLDVDVIVVGAGPAGILAANSAHRRGSRVALVSRGRIAAQTASDCRVEVASLDSGVQQLLGHSAIGIYRGGQVVVAAPLDSALPATVIVGRELILAHGKRSCVPLVPGHDLPGVMDAPSALALARMLEDQMQASIVVGTGAESVVAAALRAHGVAVIATASASSLTRIGGRAAVQFAEIGGKKLPCAILVHAGPWRTDPGLVFQARAGGTLRLTAKDMPAHVSVAGSAADPDEELVIGAPAALKCVAVCPCMDVTVGELTEAARIDGAHPEVLKRGTSCGMGPCQGFPCWETMHAVVRLASGRSLPDRPTHRPPRRGITVEQAAGLDGLLELDP